MGQLVGGEASLDPLLKFAAFQAGRFEVGDETVEKAADINAPIVSVLKLILPDVTFVQGNVELGPRFTAGTLRVGKELNKLFVPAAFKTLGNI
jgi:hypothetical protein